MLELENHNVPRCLNSVAFEIAKCLYICMHIEKTSPRCIRFYTACSVLCFPRGRIFNVLFKIMQFPRMFFSRGNRCLHAPLWNFLSLFSAGRRIYGCSESSSARLIGIIYFKCSITIVRQVRTIPNTWTYLTYCILFIVPGTILLLFYSPILHVLRCLAFCVFDEKIIY